MTRMDRQTVEHPRGTRKPEYKPVYTDTPPSSTPIPESTLRRDTGGGQSTRERGNQEALDSYMKMGVFGGPSPPKELNSLTPESAHNLELIEIHRTRRVYALCR